MKFDREVCSICRSLLITRHCETESNSFTNTHRFELNTKLLRYTINDIECHIFSHHDIYVKKKSYIQRSNKAQNNTSYLFLSEVTPLLRIIEIVRNVTDDL